MLGALKYYSLIKEADAIDRLPELKGEPVLKNLIKIANEKDGEFETFRVENKSRKLTDGRLEKTYMVGFIFRDRSGFRDKDINLLIAGRCSRLLDAACNESKSMGNSLDSPEWQQPHLLIQPAILPDEGSLEGWIVDLCMTCRGSSMLMVQNRLEILVEAFLPIFQGLPAREVH